ncbi:MAG: phosphatase PAP2 family protein [Proteobacteria bacterium]|nr:phosphatase PAP2 family protein [Pseudomonadota bacterium]
MNISLQKKPYLLIFFSFYFFSPITFAYDFTTKSTLVAISIPAIAGVYSLTSGDYEGVKELTLETLLTAQVTVLLKNSVQRTRPNGENDQSFPSGHTAAAFVGASYLHHRYGLRWGVPMYAIAAVIGYERVNVKDHYWSDVIAGAAIGYAAGAFFTAKYPHVWFEPHVDPENKAYGITVKARY